MKPVILAGGLGTRISVETHLKTKTTSKICVLGRTKSVYIVKSELEMLICYLVIVFRKKYLCAY